MNGKNLKQLLFKDLCARIPYGVKVSARYTGTNELYDGIIEGMTYIDLENIEYFVQFTDSRCPYRCGATEARPYLRPMSSMTDEELMEFGRLKYQDDENWEIVEMRVVKHDFLTIKRRNKHDEGSTWTFQISRTEPLRSWEGLDWLNEHHFDYRGLIKKGLALRAPEGMYKTE